MEAACDTVKQRLFPDAISEIEAAKSPNSVTFTWIVSDVIECPFTDYTGKIAVNDCYGNKWHITLSLLSGSRHWNLSLILVDSRNYVKATFSACVLDSDFTKKNETKETQLFHVTANCLAEFPQFLEMNELQQSGEKLLHNGDLVLCGELLVLDDDFQQDFYSVLRDNCLAQNMLSLLEHGTYADLNIRVQDREFPCHKVVLSSRSEYFRALFRFNMRKKHENTLVLKSVEPHVFEQVLRFVYTDEVEISVGNVEQLLSASEKYFLNGLKSACEEKLLKSFNICNLKVMLSNASLFHLNKLKVRALHALSIFTKRLKKEFRDDASGNQAQSTDCAETSFSEEMPLSLRKNKNAFSMHTMQRNTVFTCSDTWICSHVHVLLSHVWRVQYYFTYYYTRNKRNWVYEFGTRRFQFLGRMEICQFGCSDFDPKLCKIHFTLLSCPWKSICVGFCFSSVDTRSMKEKKVFSKLCFECSEGKTNNVFEMPVRELGEMKLREHLTIHCKCWVRRNCEHCEGKPMPKHRLRTDLCMNLNADFCDLTIRVKEAEFPCHKAIVSCRSPVLAGMIEESYSPGVVEVNGIEPEDFQQLLSYMYRDAYDLNEAEARKLLPIASRFEMQHLKIKCEWTLMKYLSFNNAVETLNLSTTYSARFLQEYALNFIVERYHEIAKMDGFTDQVNKCNLAQIMFGS